MSKIAPHVSVMLQECIEGFEGVPLKVFYEGTLGAGGHARAILEAHPEIQMYIGCDQDPQALEIAKKNLKEFGPKVQFIHGNFRDLKKHLKQLKIGNVDGFFLTSEYLQCSSTKEAKGSVFPTMAL